MISRAAWLSAALLWSPLAAAAPVFTQASVLEDDLNSVVRLGTTENTTEVDTDVDCGNSMIRVRFQGLAARQSNGVENLALPDTSPFHTVRVVSRGKTTTVVQLVPKGSVRMACQRIRAVVSADGVSIVYRLTERDQSRREAILAQTASVASKPEPKAAPAMAAESPSGPAGTDVGTEASKTAPNPEVQGSKPLFGKEKDNLPTAESTSIQESPALAAGSGPNPLLAALGCAFAGLLALAAFIVKRKGKKGGALVDMDSIEILSSKRLGARQSLVLAAVGNKRFLLAVSDKAVSTLGEVADEDALEPAVPWSLDTPLPNRRHAGVPESKERTQPASGPASQEPPEKDPRELLRQLLNTNAAPEPVFERELRAALGTALPNEPVRPSRNLSESTSDGISSNAAGLIAMARMRANMRRKPNGPTAQA
jgi:flagellar biogenesis protein FliO